MILGNYDLRLFYGIVISHEIDLYTPEIPLPFDSNRNKRYRRANAVAMRPIV